MSGLILSFRSEFYKTRKTGAFWSPILLPLLLCALVFSVFLSKSDQFVHHPGAILWFEFAGAILAPMGTLILPILIVFIAYSVNNIEHKADTWKTLFSLPISKFSVYSAKFLYALFLVFICLLLFVLFTLGFANLLSVIKPSLRFSEYQTFPGFAGNSFDSIFAKPFDEGFFEANGYWICLYHSRRYYKQPLAIFLPVPIQSPAACYTSNGTKY
jgi:hypothetical protein